MSTNASKRIDDLIADLDDWRGDRMAEIRKIIHEVDPDVLEEWCRRVGVREHRRFTEGREPGHEGRVQCA